MREIFGGSFFSVGIECSSKQQIKTASSDCRFDVAQSYSYRQNVPTEYFTPHVVPLNMRLFFDLFDEATDADSEYRPFVVA